MYSPYTLAPGYTMYCTHRWHVFLRELVGGIRNQKTSLTDGAVTYYYALDSLHLALKGITLPWNKMFSKTPKKSAFSSPLPITASEKHPTTQSQWSGNCVRKIWRTLASFCSIFNLTYLYCPRMHPSPYTGVAIFSTGSLRLRAIKMQNVHAISLPHKIKVQGYYF